MYYTIWLYGIFGLGLLLLLELLYSGLRRKKYYRLPDTLANFAMYIGFVFVYAYWGVFVYVLMEFLYEFRIFDFGSAEFTQWGLLIVLDDLIFYVFHRASHSLRILWASHVNHHSSREMNLSVALRQTWTPFLGSVFWLPLPLLGFPAEKIIIVHLCSLLFQSLLHTRAIRANWPVWNFVFNSPSHHRVHHGAQEPNLNKNFGGIFIFWDRLFGTFQPESGDIEYGIGADFDTHNPLRIAFHEWGNLFMSIWKRTTGSRT